MYNLNFCVSGSELEKTDIKKAYVNGKGCINYMMNSVPFMSVEDEPRIKEIVKGKLASDARLSLSLSLCSLIPYLPFARSQNG